MWPAAEPGYRVRFVKLSDGTRIRVVERGPEAGAPVLMLPGWGVCAYTFRGNMPALADAGFRAIAVDLRGHGRSDKPESADLYTLGSLVEHVRDIMAALALDRASVVAQSMAGRVAVELALLAPDAVTSLTLISPVSLGRVRLIGLGRLSASRILDPIAPLAARRVLFRVALETAYGKLGTVEPHEVDEYWAQTQFPGFITAVRRLLGRFDWRSVPERVAEIRVPVTVFRGTRDRIVAADAEAIAGPARLAVTHLEAGKGRGDDQAASEAESAAVRARSSSILSPSPELRPGEVATARWERQAARRLLIVDGAGHALNEEAPGIMNSALLEAVRGWTD